MGQGEGEGEKGQHKALAQCLAAASAGSSFIITVLVWGLYLVRWGGVSWMREGGGVQEKGMVDRGTGAAIELAQLGVLVATLLWLCWSGGCTWSCWEGQEGWGVVRDGLGRVAALLPCGCDGCQGRQGQ
jgi:hypothetical protein